MLLKPLSILVKLGFFLPGTLLKWPAVSERARLTGRASDRTGVLRKTTNGDSLPDLEGVPAQACQGPWTIRELVSRRICAMASMFVDHG